MSKLIRLYPLNICHICKLYLNTVKIRINEYQYKEDYCITFLLGNSEEAFTFWRLFSSLVKLVFTLTL